MDPAGPTARVRCRQQACPYGARVVIPDSVDRDDYLTGCEEFLTASEHPGHPPASLTEVRRFDLPI